MQRVWTQNPHIAVPCQTAMKPQWNRNETVGKLKPTFLQLIARVVQNEQGVRKRKPNELNRDGTQLKPQPNRKQTNGPPVFIGAKKAPKKGNNLGKCWPSAPFWQCHNRRKRTKQHEKRKRKKEPDRIKKNKKKRKKMERKKERKKCKTKDEQWKSPRSVT